MTPMGKREVKLRKAVEALLDKLEDVMEDISEWRDYNGDTDETTIAHYRIVELDVAMNVTQHALSPTQEK